MSGGFVSSAFLLPPLRGIECLSPKPLLLLLGAEMEAALIAEGSGGEAISRFFCSPFGGRQKSAVPFSLKKLRAQGDELSMRRVWELCLLPDFLLPPRWGYSYESLVPLLRELRAFLARKGHLNVESLGVSAPRLPSHLGVGARTAYSFLVGGNVRPLDFSGFLPGFPIRYR